MRSLLNALLSVALVVVPLASEAQHLNPMIPLHEKGLPVFGVTHPAIRAGGRGRGNAAPDAPPPPPIDLAAAAKATLDYKFSDFQYATSANDPYADYMREIIKAGGSAKTHAFMEKIPIWHANPETANRALIHQLNLGQVGVMMQEVASAQEIRDVAKAARFESAGGTRPDTGIELAAQYWGMKPQDYKKKADVWPLNKNGEIIIWAIVESKEGLANVEEIAKEPAATVIWAGYGTLGQVFRGDPDGREQAAQTILAACKKFKKPCGFPVNNTTDLAQRMKEGWSVFVFQARGDSAFAGIDAGRKAGGR